MTTRNILIDALILDAGTQLRDTTDPEQEAHLAEVVNAGGDLTPVQVVDTDEGPILAHGFTRVGVLQSLGKTEVEAEVVPGTVRDAMLIAIQANSVSVVPRSVQTKRNAVDALLDDPEWSRLSVNQLAEMAHVSRNLVDARIAERGIGPIARVNTNGVVIQPREKKRSRTLVLAPKVEKTEPIYKPGEVPAASLELRELAKEYAEDPKAATKAIEVLQVSDDTLSTEGSISEEFEPISDEEWLLGLVRQGKTDVRAALSDPCRVKFDHQALLYRKVQADDGIRTAKAKIAKMIGTKRAGKWGPFSQAWDSALSFQHPSFWVLCFDCKGSGANGSVGECPACHGNGFKRR